VISPHKNFDAAYFHFFMTALARRSKNAVASGAKSINYHI